MFKRFLSISFIVTVLFFQGCGTSSRSSDEPVDNLSIENKSTEIIEKLTFENVKKPKFIEGETLERGHYREIIHPLEVPSYYTDLRILEENSNYTMYENGLVSEEGKLSVSKGVNDITNEMMLLLDFSGSIVDEGCDLNTTCSQLIDNVKNFIDNVVLKYNISLSIYYFNASNEIFYLDRTTKYPTTSIYDLKNSIEKLRDPDFMEQLQEYSYSTNLYGALENATQKFCDMSGCDEDDESDELEELYVRSIVFFTDGKDTANVISKDKMLESLRKDKIEYYSMGLGEADPAILEEISEEKNYFYSVDDFNGIFNDLLKTIEIKSNFLVIDFCPSIKGGDSIDVKFLYDDKNGITSTIPEQKVDLIDSDFACDIN